MGLSPVSISPATFTGPTNFLHFSSRFKPSISFFTNPSFASKHISSSLSSMASITLTVHASSSSTGATNQEVDSSNPASVGATDLLIVGPGVLGRLVAENWRKEYPGCQITGETVTTDHHDELIKMGINPTLKGVKREHKFPYVIYCAPPSRSSDYAGDVGEAASMWNGEGSFLFTSSSAPYDRYDNGDCNEDSPVVPIGKSPRTDILLKAEKKVLEAGGCVVRLAGLYKLDRGMHLYYLKQGTIEANPHHLVNLIHYEDAASLCVAILKKKLCGRLFLGCDNHPVSRQEVMDLVAKSGKFDNTFVGFTGTDGVLGKKLNNSKTREEIGWEPKYKSFTHCLGVAE
ncbi:putative NAD(P)-binding domain superfamily [Helianthus annuus]|nr:uncharacterized protein LOC110899240 [Helianthus annuus]KAJ0477617.1 putative NAD(P)-binding domain superfamily [Helianthus annuus]KAJ0482140.1 putative NAD(P)-binding domain superfamily [Helianthus annuus]KAJ0498448.1 putative NAD(P)-binding domain superfamily [Helianthus annuus]KAJ0664461.1 putative NAD(P)-binding domain superfamily [Helianthus annuus]KAJ0671915.1 putative NAD(P)-binding domain superfamily [Helianthus annuus]